MWRLAPRLADAEIHRRLAEINRHKLAMNIVHMQQRDVASRVEPERFGWGRALRPKGPRDRAFAGRKRGRRGADLKNFPTVKSGQICSMPDARHAQLQTFVLRRQIQFEIAVFLCVRRKLIGANIDLAPLEALTDIPDLQQAGAPGREMVVLAFRLAEPLATYPVVRDFAVAIGARHVELGDLALRDIPDAHDS